MAKKVADLFDTVTLDGNKLDAQREALLAQLGTFAGNMQMHLVGLIIHASLHGDVDKLNKLDASVGKGEYTPLQRASMRAWVIKNGPCGWSPKNGDKPARFSFNKDKAKALADRYNADAKATINALMAVVWYEARKEKDEFTGFDLDKVLNAAIKRAERMMEEHPEMVGEEIKVDRLPALRALMSSKGNKRKIRHTPAPTSDVVSETIN